MVLKCKCKCKNYEHSLKCRRLHKARVFKHWLINFNMLDSLRVFKHWLLHLDSRAFFRKGSDYLVKKINQTPFTKKIFDSLNILIFDLFGYKLGVLYHHPPKEWDPCFRLMENNIPTQEIKVSIVTPSYKQGNFLERTIVSVLSQDYPHLEYIIQDGGSDDCTHDVINKYINRIDSFSSFSDGGQSNAINLGFKKATGEIMMWLNSDDLLLPGALNTVVNFFSSHPNVDVLYGNRLLIDENDMQIGVWVLPDSHDAEAIQWADFIPQETLFWRRSAWEKVGSSIDTNFKFAMDWDLLLRFQDAQLNIHHIPNFLGAFRIHPQQKSSALINEVGRNEMSVLRKRNFGRIPSDKEIYDAVTPFLVKHRKAHLKWLFKKQKIRLQELTK